MVVTLTELIALVRSPRALLRAERPGEPRVLVDDLPLSGVQAAVLLLAGLARNGRFVAVSPRTTRRLGFVRYAACATAIGLAGELARSRRLYRRAVRAAARDPRLARRAPAPDSVLYLRTDPSLRWRGHVVVGAATRTSGVMTGFAANGLAVEVVAPERPGWTDATRFTPVDARRAFHVVPWLTLAPYSGVVAEAAAGRRPGFVYQRCSVRAWAGLQRQWGGEAQARSPRRYALWRSGTCARPRWWWSPRSSRSNSSTTESAPIGCWSIPTGSTSSG